MPKKCIVFYPLGREHYFKRSIALALLFIMIVQAFAAICSAEVYFDPSTGYYLDDFEGENETLGLNYITDAYVHEGNITLEYDYYLGTGSDGDLYVTSPTTLWRGSKLHDANASSSQIEPYNIAVFEEGDELLVINMMSGIWETVFVKNVSSPYLNLETPLRNYYYENSKAQIVHIWHFNNVTVNGSTLTTQAWNGDTGGILAFRATGSVTLNSTGSIISATGKGFSGGVGGMGGYGGDKGSGGLGAEAGDTNTYMTFNGLDGSPGSGASGGNGYKGVFPTGPPAGYDVYVGGGKGGRGGNFGYSGWLGQIGVSGKGLGGGAGGYPANGGNNPTSPQLTIINMGGGGGGGGGGEGGQGGCGGGGGGGSINAGNDGEDGGRGGEGGSGGNGGIGGGIIFYSCKSLNNYGIISTNGTQGSPGLAAIGGEGGGHGGAGAPAMVYINGSGDTSHWGAGGGGGGGMGGSGGDGGYGGGGGAGGSILIQAYNINSSYGNMYVGGGSGGIGGSPGAGGVGGLGGAGGIDTYGGWDGESGTSGTGGSMGIMGGDGYDGESGFIRLDYIDLSDGFTPSSPVHLNNIIYKSSGEARSQVISPPDIVKWWKFTADTTVPDNCSLEFYIIDPVNDTVFAFGDSSQVSETNGGIELDRIPVSSLQILAILQTEDTLITPVIHSWNLSWEASSPQAPENLAANLSKDGSYISLSWDAVSFWKDLTGYNIYRSEDGVSYTLFDSVDNTTLIYQDTQVEIGRTYKYKVTATSSNDLESPFSNPVQIFNDKDWDLDGVGNLYDDDDDGDGVHDFSDAFPLNSSEWLDSDFDGIGNELDDDDDNDGVPDGIDPYPLNPLNEIQAALDYINTTVEDIQSRAIDLALQLSGVNDSIFGWISGSESNILDELAEINTSLASEIKTQAAGITNDIIGMNSSLSDQLNSLLNNLTTEDGAFRAWLDLVLDTIDKNLTATNDSLGAQLSFLDTYIAGFNISLQTELGDILSELQQHDQDTGQDHSEIITKLDDILSGGVGADNLNELKSILTNLSNNVSVHDQSIADDIDEVIGDIEEFELNTSQKMESIDSTLDDLAKLEDILSDLNALNRSLAAAHDQLQESVDEIPAEKGEKEEIGMTEILLIVVIVLLIVNLLVTMMRGKKEGAKGAKALSEEEVEPKSRAKGEEEEWEEEGEEIEEDTEEEPEEEYEEDIEEIFECPECGAHVGPTETACPNCGEEFEVDED
ncbi:MAG: hypothetical protein JSW00_02625 [Thermoplasmata archaeon]|nr:MAG: hypothetical protein JSW00_02625 [Thermoplasmata archaeon]